MRIKTLNVILVITVLLVFFVLVGWHILFLVFPVPEILALVPGVPLVYINILNLDEALTSIKGSEFVNRVAISPLWEKFKSSELWQKLNEQKTALEQQLGLDRKTIMKLLGKNALLALYGDNKQEGFLLIGEGDLIARIVVLSGNMEKRIASNYEFTKEEYKGIDLMTVKDQTWTFSYGFVGRAGLLSNDISIVKASINAYKGNENGLAMVSGFRELISDLPGSDTSFYINMAKVRDAHQLLQSYRLNVNQTFMQRINSSAGVLISNDGNLRVDSSVLYERKKLTSNTAVSDNFVTGNLPVPDNCLAFMAHERLEPEAFFKFLEKFIDPRLSILRERLPPVLRNGMATAIIEPNLGEFQLLPPLIVFLRVKDKLVAEKVLSNLRLPSKKGYERLKFSETVYENTLIKYASSLPGAVLPIGLGYTFINGDLLAIATDIQAIKAVIDVALGKSQPLMKDKRYINVLMPIAGNSDNKVFVNLKSAASIIEQSARLYLLQAQLTGNRSAEKFATTLSENAFILSAWHYLGAVFGSEGDKVNLKLIVSDTNK